MNLEEISLKANSLLRRAGIADIPRSVLLGVIAIGLVLVLMAVWHFWPRPSANFISNANASSQEAPANSEDNSSSQAPSSSKEIVVDVEGAVNAPGLYTLPEDSRIGDAIKAAGGLTADAVPGSANLAQKVSDGEQVIVPSIHDANQSSETQPAGSQPSSSSGKSGQNANGKININTASAEELQKLSGVGPSLSERIIEYRQSNGCFLKIEDLQNVSGIGETRFANLKDKICV